MVASKMAASFSLAVIASCLLFSGCQADASAVKELRELTEAISSQKADLVASFEEIKEQLKQDLGEIINGAQNEFRTLNNNTRTDVATLQYLLDQNECEDGTHNCSSDATCVDTRVSYQCSCKRGFTGDGFTCTDVDECTEKYRCGPYASCTNRPGSYSCACKAGFKGEGDKCEDIDECSNGTNNCHKFAVCKNTIGSFTCTCTLYHEGDGIRCQEIEVAGCDSPFKFVRGVGCIHIIERSQNFERSRDSCKKLDADLFTAINKEHYLRLAKHFIDTNQKAIKKYMWVGVKEGVWLNGRKVAPEEEAPGNPSMSSGRCSYTDGDSGEKFLLWTDPCNDSWWSLCQKKVD